MLQNINDYLTPEKQAHIYATGLTTIFVLGSIALFAILLAALWLAMQFALIVCTSVVASCNELATTFSNADPFVKLVLLFALAFIAFGLVRKFWRF